jgi:hypothetical protein
MSPSFVPMLMLDRRSIGIALKMKMPMDRTRREVFAAGDPPAR